MMAKSILGVFVFTLLNFGLSFCQPKSDEVYLADGVNKLWETSRPLKTPESVLFDEKRQRFYVSNMANGAQEKDGKGFISILKEGGKVKTLKWVEGLNAPKGMALRDGKLYVSDIDQVVVIDVKKAKVLNKCMAKGAKFLNDVAIDKQGRVYVSDMYAHRIYRLAGGKLKAWSNANALNRPNGLYFRKGRLFVGNDDKLIALNVKTGSVTKIGGNTGPIDGLIALGNKRFLTTDWKGRLYLRNFTDGHEQTKLLDTRKVDQNAADMAFVHSKNKVVIPTFSDNRVMAYKVSIGE